MTTKNTGGPAFPSAVPHISQNNTTGETTQYQYQTDGMTLRDYFAAKAMHSLNSDEGYANEMWPNNLAKDAYRVADAMLAAREEV